MSKLEELEQVIEKLPPEDFAQLSAWMARREAARNKSGSQMVLRDHSAFLKSYSDEDEGLYDAQSR